MEKIIKEYDLTDGGIDAASEAIGQFLAQAHVAKREALQVRLAMEEALLNYRERNAAQRFSLCLQRRLRSIRVEAAIPGESLDPFREGNEPAEGGAMLSGMMANMGLAPLWQYRDGTNRVLFTPKPERKQSPMASMGIAVGLAVVLGLLGQFLPGEVRGVITGKIIDPIFGTFMGLLSAVAGPMIFLSVTWGICCIGDTATFGRIGKRMVSHFVLMTFLLTAVGSAVMLPLFPVTAGGGSAFDPSELMEMVLDIVPDNFFTPFTEGNPLQIIFVAVLIGIAVLILGEKVSVAATFIEQANYVVQLIMGAVSAMVPVFVFGSILNMLLSDDLAVLLHSYKILPAMAAGYVLIMLVYVVWVCLKNRVRPGVILKKTLPTFLVGLSTASSVAAYPTNVACCEEDLGIDPKIIRFGVPLGQVVFMPGASVMFMAAALSMAEVYDVTISLSWLLTALFITAVLAIAAPPVPGSTLTCYTLLFVQLGVPAEAVAITTALNVVLEFTATAVDLFVLQMGLTVVGGSLDMLDGDTLRRGGRKPAKAGRA